MSECAVNEHLEIIAALRKGDAPSAVKLMEEHVGSVEKRAVLGADMTLTTDLGAILGRYSSAIMAPKRLAFLSVGERRRRA